MRNITSKRLQVIKGVLFVCFKSMMMNNKTDTSKYRYLDWGKRNKS